MKKSQPLIFAFVAAGLALLLLLDLMNRGLVWRALRALRSETTGSLPGEDRTVGERHRADVTFLS